MPDVTAHFGKYHIEILAPKGVNGGFVQDFVEHTNEFEFTLNRNTKFEVVGVKQNKIKKQYRDIMGKAKTKTVMENILQLKVVE